MDPLEVEPIRVLGRYALYGAIASGGMATVHFGRLLGPVGFSRTVAIKRLHPQFARDPEFVSGFLDEARLAARIRHPNVVPTLDVVATEGELFLVMEYVQGESLGRIFRKLHTDGNRVPPNYASAIVAGALHGLHAAHEARNERGEALAIVHRDVSPQNILVGADGIARVLDFGVAKAAGRLQTTRDGQLKGKMAYMAPEQIRGEHVDRRTDVYAAAVVLWEALAGQRLFKGENDVEVFGRVLAGKVEPPSKYAPGIPFEIDATILQGLARDPQNRFQTAREMARALERHSPLVAPAELGEWVEEVAAHNLASRADTVARIENSSRSGVPVPVVDSPSPASSERGRITPGRGWETMEGRAPTSAVTAAPEVIDIPIHDADGTETQLSSGSISQPHRWSPRRPFQSIFARMAAAAASLFLVTLALIAMLRSPDRSPSVSADTPDEIPEAPDPVVAAAPAVAAEPSAPPTSVGADVDAGPTVVAKKPTWRPAPPPKTVTHAKPNALDGVLNTRQ